MNNLKKLRKENGLTQQQLADELNSIYKNTKSYSKMNISNWENEKHSISTLNAEQLSSFFDVPISYLLGYSEYPDEFFAFSEFRKQNKDDWANIAKYKILSLVTKTDLEKIKDKYIKMDGPESDWESYTMLLSAIGSLPDKESKMLTLFALLSDQKQDLLLELVQTMVDE